MVEAADVLRRWNFPPSHRRADVSEFPVCLGNVLGWSWDEGAGSHSLMLKGC